MFDSNLQRDHERKALSEGQWDLAARVARLTPVGGKHRSAYPPFVQFSREYRRLFGAPPRAKIARLRESGARE
jgi:hypothetical protein